MKTIAVLLIKIYKMFISPILVSVLGHGCRYSPTCSTYAVNSIEKYGIITGGRKSIKRIISCNSFVKSPQGL